MKSPPIAVLLAVFGLAVTSASAAGTAADTSAKPKKDSGFVFSLFPKSLQRNPKLDFNIITEMTPEGRRWLVPTQDHPIYFISVSGGVYNGGLGAEYNVKTPPPEKLELLMKKALAESFFLPSDDKTHPAAIAVIYHWGSHSFSPDADIQDDNGQSINPQNEVQMRKVLLDRAKLLGGMKFAQQVADTMEQIDQKAMIDRSSNAAIAASGGGSFMGSVGDAIPDPWDALRARSPELDRLVDELFSSSFFVVASAYDYAALAKKERHLLWRTKMTVNSIGVNMLESVPPLIASAGPYFGHEMPDPVVITKKVSRDGKVEVGTPVVVPDSTTAATTPKPATPTPPAPTATPAK